MCCVENGNTLPKSRLLGPKPPATEHRAASPERHRGERPALTGRVRPLIESGERDPMSCVRLNRQSTGRCSAGAELVRCEPSGGRRTRVRRPGSRAGKELSWRWPGGRHRGRTAAVYRVPRCPVRVLCRSADVRGPGRKGRTRTSGAEAVGGRGGRGGRANEADWPPRGSGRESPRMKEPADTPLRVGSADSPPRSGRPLPGRSEQEPAAGTIRGTPTGFGDNYAAGVSARRGLMAAGFRFARAGF